MESKDRNVFGYHSPSTCTGSILPCASLLADGFVPHVWGRAAERCCRTRLELACCYSWTHNSAEQTPSQEALCLAGAQGRCLGDDNLVGSLGASHRQAFPWWVWWRPLLRAHQGKAGSGLETGLEITLLPLNTWLRRGWCLRVERAAQLTWMENWGWFCYLEWLLSYIQLSSCCRTEEQSRGKFSLTWEILQK